MRSYVKVTQLRMMVDWPTEVTVGVKRRDWKQEEEQGHLCEVGMM